MEKARDLGERQDRADIVSYALNGIGLGLVVSGREGVPVLERALQVGLDADLHEAAGRAYSSLQEACTRLNRFADSERYHAEGVAYCEGRELGVFSLCLMGWRARTLILAGRWDEATEVCAQMLGRRGISPVNRINPLQVLGTIRGCRGEDGAWDLLDEALALAEGTGDPLWIAPVRTARAELRWLSGEPRLAAREVESGYDQAAGCAEPWTFGSLVIWLFRLGARMPAELPACPSRTRGRWPATGPARPRPGSGSAGPTTPRWPGSAAPTRPRCATRWPPSTPSAPGPPPPRPGGG